MQTGAVDSIAEHPFDLLARLRFRVTVNTDNRLMSDTTMSQEMLRLVEAFGYGWSDLQRFTINAMKSAFISFDERLAIIDDVIKPRYAALIGGLTAASVSVRRRHAEQRGHSTLARRRAQMPTMPARRVHVHCPLADG